MARQHQSRYVTRCEESHTYDWHCSTENWLTDPSLTAGNHPDVQYRITVRLKIRKALGNFSVR